MAYITAWHTDIGIQKKTNQDSLLLMQAQTGAGDVLLGVLCDGMGGLEKGEVASGNLVSRFRDWFYTQLSGLLQQPEFSLSLSESWNRLIQEENRRIAAYGALHSVSLGTTVTAVLLVGRAYYILNVGDCRVYQLSDTIYQLTKDQTWVQNELDAGRLTLEQALTDPRQNVLLQCVGASSQVHPDFLAGTLQEQDRLLLCCDGFRHQVSPGEIYRGLNQQAAPTRQEMEQGLRYLVDLNKQRNEVDNITAILIEVHS